MAGEKTREAQYGVLLKIQEEIGLYGARHADVKLLGSPKLAFNWDGGAAEKLGIPTRTLDSKIKRLGINKFRFKDPQSV